MTYRQAKKLLSPGDIVFIPMGGRIVRAKVLQIKQDHLYTDQDNLFFDEVGDLWFLTLRCAVATLRKVNV